MTPFVLNKDICTCSKDSSHCNSSSDFDAICQKTEGKNYCRKTFSLNSPLTSFIDCVPESEMKRDTQFDFGYAVIYDLSMLTSADGSENTLTMHCRELGKCFEMDYSILLNYLQSLATTLTNLISSSTSNLTCDVLYRCRTDGQQTLCGETQGPSTTRCDRSKLADAKNVIRHEVVWLNSKSSTTRSSMLCRGREHCNRKLLNMSKKKL